MADSGGSTTTTSPEATPLQPFDQLSVRALLEQLSSREPIPGGGSAAALAGSLGPCQDPSDPRPHRTGELHVAFHQPPKGRQGYSRA